jgi:hypothetical protein
MKRLASSLLGWLAAALTLLPLWSCNGASASPAPTTAVIVRVLGTQFRVYWFFRAVGPVPAIIATAGVTDNSQPLHSDSLPPTATVDSATFNLPAVGTTLTGTACSRSSQQTAAQASCKPWSVTGSGTVTDSTIIKLVLLPSHPTVIALTSPTQVPGDSNRVQFCCYAQTGDSVYHTVSNSAGIPKCDSTLKTFPKWSLTMRRVPGIQLSALYAQVDITVLEPNTHRTMLARN